MSKSVDSIFPKAHLMSGLPDAPVIVIGDHPTYEDDYKGKSFSDGQANLVRVLLDKAGFDLQDVLFINVIDERVRTKGGIQLPAMDEAKQQLIDRIKAYHRDVVITLGNTAAYAAGAISAPKGCTGDKVRLHTWFTGEFDFPIVCANNPFIVAKDPNQATMMQQDFKYAHEIANGKERRKYAKHVIKLIDTPEDINRMMRIARKPEHDLIAFDHETTHKYPYAKLFKIVTTAFHMGEVNREGKKVARVWCGYDKLQPLYEQHVMEMFHEAFVEFYAGAGKDYDFLAWNSPFDAWATLREYPELKDMDWAGVLHDGMVSSYICDSETPNGLKFNSSHYRGYKYADKVEESVSATVARRGRVLRDPNDFDTLRRWGVEPVAKLLRNGDISHKWPSKDILDKKVEAYALVGIKALKKYNALDAIHTYEVFMEDHVPQMQKEGLIDAYEFRMRIVRRLLRGEMRGMKLDKVTNRAFSEELKQIIARTEVLLNKRVRNLGWDEEEQGPFNPNSPVHLSRILYGEPSQVPSINMDSIISQTSRRTTRYEAREMSDQIVAWHDEFYQDWKSVRKLLRTDSYDYESASRSMRKQFLKDFPQFSYVNIEPRRVFVKGLYEPIAYTKTGAPATAVAILQTLYERKENDFLHLILMYRKATKLKSTFVDAIYHKAVKGISYPHYNPIGTKSGRISGCVIKGTMIVTDRGRVPVEFIQAGDRVLTHKGRYRQVLVGAFTKPPTMLYRVDTASGRSITVSGRHKFLTNSGWQELNDLAVGEQVTVYSKESRFTKSAISAIVPVGEDAPWDFTVAGDSSYVAHGFVNHNSDFNPQNFPKYTRGQFKARKGYRILTFDLSQAEIRAVAAYSQDPDLIAALDSEDIHRRVASMVYEKPEKEISKVERDACKAVVFGILYGRGRAALALALNWTEDQAQAFIDMFFGRFPRLKEWIDSQIEAAYQPPYACRTPWGTKRSLRNILSSDKGERSHIERVSVNSPIQGAAGEYTLC